MRELAEEPNGVFGPTLKSFITCTLAVKAKDPHVSLYHAIVELYSGTVFCGNLYSIDKLNNL